MSIKTAPILLLYQKRVFWLVFLVFGSLLSGLGIAHFEDLIAAHIVLVFSFLYWWEVGEMRGLSLQP